MSLILYGCGDVDDADLVAGMCGYSSSGSDEAISQEGLIRNDLKG
jgi:hypothetical protein